jgi:hypothetical protein
MFQRRNGAIQRLRRGAAEEHDDGDREGKQIGRLKGIRSFSELTIGTLD